MSPNKAFGSNIPRFRYKGDQERRHGIFHETTKGYDIRDDGSFAIKNEAFLMKKKALMDTL